MGKKNNLKTQDNEDPLEETAEAVKGSKKSKKSKKKAFDEDDIARELEELSLEVNGVLPSNKTEREKQSQINDKENKKDEEEGRVSPNIGGGFSALVVMDDIDKEDQPSDSSVKQKSKKKEEKASKPEPPSKKDKSKKKNKQWGNDDEELEDLLAEIEAEYAGEKKEDKTVDKKDKVEVTDKNSKSEPHSKKEKNKKKSKQRGNDEDEDLDELLAEIESTNKGPKKAGKSINEKQAINKSSKSKSTKDAPRPINKQSEKTFTSEDTPSKNEQLEKEKKDAMEEINENEEREKTDEQDEVGNTKSKSGKEEGKTRKGKPNKKMLEAMKAMLAKQKEEEERRLKILEEKRREEEERMRQLEEQRRLEEERKERQKEKQREKLKRLKEEGKLLTPRQKQEQKRMQAMLEHLKAQGVMIPESGRGPPSLSKKKKKKPDQGEVAKDEDAQVEESEPEVEADLDTYVVMEQASEAKPVAVEKVENEEDNVVDEWDQLSESEDEKDSHPPSTQVSESVKPKKVTIVEEVAKTEKLPQTEGEDEHLTEAEKKRERALSRLAQRKEENEKKKSLTKLRSPVVCVLGHVDHGKTKILDKLRRTNVQEGEVGGITQQIGATNVPFDAINSQTRMVKDFPVDEMTLPGLLIIDTPGHESFSNLRSRGSSLCDIAILVIDITQGLEPQTIESINLLKSKKTPFIVALNKVDRIFEWESYPTKDIREAIKMQNEPCQYDFERRSSQVIQALNIQGLNAALFWENPDARSYVSLVPTSAISGDGMGNLMALITSMCQKRMASRLMLSEELQCTVLEVKTIQGHGTTIDVILVNGRLREGDTIVLAGTEGPIVTQIRSLLIPKPLKEIRVKGQYDELKEVQAALGVKIAARELDKAIAGLNLQVAHHEDEVDILKEEVDREFKRAMRSMKVKEKGVYVQASTLGALEALLEFFKANKVPYAGIRVGPVVKRDVMKATAMLEHDPMYAVILAFDVKVERDAQELADKEGIKIFSEETIYHLGDRYVEYIKEYKKKKQDEFKDVAVFPCRLKIIGDSIFNKRDPIVLGVTVDVGILRTGTPLCVPSKEFVEIGVVTSLEYDHKAVEIAKRGVNVCMKVEPLPGHTPKMFGRHFDVEDILVSKISRESIDACKEYFRDDLGKTEWKLMAELKKEFGIL